FLRKINIRFHAAVIGSLLFSFSGYMTLNSHWYHYLNYAVFAGLMLFLFERWFQEEKWILMVLAVGLACIKGVLQIYQFAFFLGFYGLFRILYEKGFKFKEGIFFFLKFYGLYALGIGLGAFYILPELYQAVSSARGGESIHKFTLIQWMMDALRISDPSSIRTFLLRFFSNDILGSYERFKGVSNYLEAPAAYCGLLTLFTAPLVFFQGNRREKIAFSFLMGSCILYFLFPYVRVIGNAFASGTSKHTIMYHSMMLIIMAAYSLNRFFKEDPNRSGFLFIPFAFFSGIWIMGWTIKEMMIDGEVLRYVGWFILGYGILFILFSFLKIREYVKYALVAAVIVELTLFAHITISRSSGALTSEFIEKKELYFDQDTMDALEFIRNSDQSFFRVEKGYTSVYLNDAVVQGYYGTSAYYGFSSMGVVDFHRSMRISTQSPRIASYRYGLSKRHQLQELLCVKYYLSRNPEDKPLGFDHVRTFGNVLIFQNQKFRPLGLIYHRFIPRADFEVLPMESKEKAILKYAVSNEVIEGFEKAAFSDREMEKEDQFQDDLRPESFAVTFFKEDHIIGNIHLEKDGILFFAIPFDKGWKAVVDGKEEKPKLINIGFMGFPVSKGDHHIELRFTPPYLFTGSVVSFVCIILISVLFLKFPKINALTRTMRASAGI
ncbi:MAG: YfhO family protein, partial [Thermodesulfobacteriota bacterium]